MGLRTCPAPLTVAQESLLVEVQNVTILPLYPPYEYYIVAVEKVCHKCNPKAAEELKPDTNRLLNCSWPSKPNTSKEEAWALKEH